LAVAAKPSDQRAGGGSDQAFGGMGKPVNENVYSDHFPINVQFIEDD
jgi:hypothetical protein